MERFFIDLHVHSALKPYSRSFRVDENGGANHPDPEKKNSIWHKKGINLIKKVFNSITSLTKFTQADFTTSDQAGAKLILVSIDPMEKELVLSRNRRKPQNLVGKLIKDLVIGIGLKRVHYMTKKMGDDYFGDLVKTRDYMLQLNKDNPNRIADNGLYRVLGRFPASGLDHDLLNVIFTIEGGHVFNTKSFQDKPITIEGVLENVRALKAWPIRPCWISLAHHFKNNLCGQAESFTGFLPKLAYRQELRPNEGIRVKGNGSDWGERVIKELLYEADGAKRVLIDLKHMNLKSRLDFYHIVEATNTPIVVSHGALTFRPYPREKDTNTIKWNNEINFYDEEIIKIGRSKGLFGIQLDSRRLKYVKKLPRSEGRKPPKIPNRKKRIKQWETTTGINFKQRHFRRTYYIWKQASHMAQLLNKNTEYDGGIWSIQAIGSDFDGIVNPLDGFWTHGNFKTLYEYIKLHAEIYLQAGGANDADRPNETEITDRLFFKNSERFLKQNFR